MKKQLQKAGDTRYALLFALFPIVCESREFVWLEFVVVKQYCNVLSEWKNDYIPDKEEVIKAKDVRLVGLIAKLMIK